MYKIDIKYFVFNQMKTIYLKWNKLVDELKLIVIVNMCIRESVCFFLISNIRLKLCKDIKKYK